MNTYKFSHRHDAPVDCPRCGGKMPPLAFTGSVKSMGSDWYATRCDCGMSLEYGEHNGAEIHFTLRLSEDKYLQWTGWLMLGDEDPFDTYKLKDTTIRRLDEPWEETSFRCVLPFDITLERAKNLVPFI